jgi:hypothetical protein
MSESDRIVFLVDKKTGERHGWWDFTDGDPPEPLGILREATDGERTLIEIIKWAGARLGKLMEINGEIKH